MRVIGADHRLLAARWGRCRAMRSLHFAAASTFMESCPILAMSWPGRTSAVDASTKPASATTGGAATNSPKCRFSIKRKQRERTARNIGVGPTSGTVRRAGMLST